MLATNIFPQRLAQGQINLFYLGRDLILATALGYDIAARCALSAPVVAVTPEKEVKYPAVFGYSYAAFGSTVAAAKVLSLNAEQLAHAIWLTAYLAPLSLSTLWRNSSCANTAKYADLGWFTHAGVVGCLQAQHGLVGDVTILDSDDFWKACGVDNFDYGSFLEELGKKWYIMESSMKPFPCCRHFHAAIDMYARIAEENKLEPDDIERINIKIPPTVLRPNYVWARTARWDVLEPKDYVSSEFSFPYNLACAAYGITPNYEWHIPETMNDPRLAEFCKKVTLEGNPESVETAESVLKYKGPPGAIRRKFPVTIEIRAKGQVFQDEADYARGDSGVPGFRMSHEDIEKKFKANVAGVLKNGQASKALDCLRKLEEVKNINMITKCLTVSATER